jgi:hypothetical protein
MKHTRSRRHAQRKTRKGGRGTTVESLHSSFKQIDVAAKKAIERGDSEREVIQCIRREWSAQFQSQMSAAAAEGLAKHYMTVYKPSKRTTRKQKQRGGMAPLDWTMGQGTTQAVYGSFPVEMGTSPQVVRALDNDRFSESPIGRSCNNTGIWDGPAQNGGRRRQHGGSIWDSLTTVHAPPSVPRNILESTVSTIQGAPIVNPPASPVVAVVPLAAPTPVPYDPSGIADVSRVAHVYHGY